MLFATGTILHRVMTFAKSPMWTFNFSLGLCTYLVGLAIYHCYAVEIAAHQGSFVVMVIWIATKTRQLIRQRAHEERLKQKMGQLAKIGSRKSCCL